jgi:superfamily II DNA or RNA helicase
MVHISFQNGTLVLRGPAEILDRLGNLCVFDARISGYRAQAYLYAAVVSTLEARGVDVRDEAKGFAALSLTLHDAPAPRPYQSEAVDAWRAQRRRGVVVLPTGSGKSLVACLALAATPRTALVVVPTIDLMQQWASQLERVFRVPVGLLGGGSRDIRDITVSTYDSASMLMEFHGSRFGLLIVDECHHLPGPTNSQAASMSIAPYRLGLTATPEREDDGEQTLYRLLGPVCYRRDIDELEGSVLSPYRTTRIPLPLDADEAEAYERNRRIYLAFVRENGIALSDPRGWSHFLGLCARRPNGRRAFEAYLAQKRIARTSRAKFTAVWRLLRDHAGERVLVFTADNDTAYALGNRFFLPVITHHTRVQERKDFLDAFRSGDYPVLVTSKVLNEGIDVPEASVGIVVSGSASTREHVQRLGRILRPARGKQAVLYELVSVGTSESSVSERRRRHRAYQRPGKMSR